MLSEMESSRLLVATSACRVDRGSLAIHLTTDIDSMGGFPFLSLLLVLLLFLFSLPPPPPPGPASATVTIVVNPGRHVVAPRPAVSAKQQTFLSQSLGTCRQPTPVYGWLLCITRRHQARSTHHRTLPWPQRPVQGLASRYMGPLTRWTFPDMVCSRPSASSSATPSYRTFERPLTPAVESNS